MTLKELFDRCDFKNIAPKIAEISSSVRIHRFKEAFDYLRRLEPQKCEEYPNDVIEIYIVEREWGGFVKAGGNLDESSWAFCLAKEIVVAEGLTLTDNEIAAHCLLEMTFWGDDAKMPKPQFCDIYPQIDNSNPYAVAAAANKLSNKLCDKCIEALERMAKVEDVIRRLILKSDFIREELEYLFKTDLIHEDMFRSLSYNVDQRIDYLIDVFSNYVCDDFSKFTHFLLMFRTSPEYEFTREEWSMIFKFFSQRLPSSANIRYGYGTDAELGTEVSLLFVSNY
jgi:hypothetical protein